MSIDFSVPGPVAEIASRTASFVREVVIPAEESTGGDIHQGPEDLRTELQQAARDAGVFCPQAPIELGGAGLDIRGQAVVFEEAGYSLLGPLAMNCAAPDEGNMHLLRSVGTAEQQQRFLRPLISGEIRSAFAMTEPNGGAGADPRGLQTTAVRVPGGWQINGHKWFISGMRGAGLTICMARTSGSPGDPGGASMFLIEGMPKGLRVVRDIPTMDRGQFGGHSEISFENCFVPDEQVLGEIDEGFGNAQVRLGPARLTHCMRWLGVARRAQDIAIRYTHSRSSFGYQLSDLGMTQQKIADSEIEIVAARAMIYRCAWQLDQNPIDADASQYSSMTKVFVAETVWQIVDRAVQMCGALGISEDVLLSRYLRDIRAFRVYDGPSDTHRWAIAKRVVKNLPVPTC